MNFNRNISIKNEYSKMMKKIRILYGIKKLPGYSDLKESRKITQIEIFLKKLQMRN